MINLLPQREREILTQEENWKLILILGIIFLTFLISLALILFSIQVYISGQIEAQKILFSQKEVESSKVQDFQEKIKLTNLSFSKLNSFYQGVFNGSEILEKTSGALPPGTYLTNFTLSTITGEEEYPAQISLSGFSPNRETLLEFKKNLESQELFKEVYFPPSNWVEPINIDFSVNFKITK